MFQKFHEQRETWQVSAAKTEERGGGRKQSQACAAHSDSITTPVKDPACLPQLSEARPARERDRERVTEQRERERDETKHRAQRDETV